MADPTGRTGGDLMTDLNRRLFLGATGSLLASRALAAPAKGEAVRVGVVGVGSRGSVLLSNLLAIPGVAVRAVCDIDAGRLDRAIYVERGTMTNAAIMPLADKLDTFAPYFAVVLVPGWEGRN